MGKQLNYYLNQDEDFRIAEYLDKRGAVCIPESCASSSPEPVRATDCFARSVRVLMPEFSTLAFAHLQSPNNRFWRLTHDGLYIEWTRCIPNTSKSPNYVGPRVYTKPGRIYFCASDLTAEVEKCSNELEKLYMGIARFIQKMSMKIDSYVVGNDLLLEAERCQAKLFYRNKVTPLPIAGQGAEKKC